MPRMIRTAVCSVALFLAFCQAGNAESRSFSLRDPRPVGKALEQIEAIYGLPVTYEDPPYMHKSQLTRVNDKILIPKGGYLTFAYELPSYGSGPGGGLRQSMSDRKAAVVAAVSSALSGYGKYGGSAVFDVLEAGSIFHVVPREIMDSTGVVRQATPLLNTMIMVPAGKRKGTEFLDEICRALTISTGHQVDIGTIPWLLFAQQTMDLEGSTDTARNLLDRLLMQIRKPLSWRLLYDPESSMYALNIHVVTWRDK